MGLLDVLNGMQNGPRGHTDPNSKGGMSPITMAILALLAYKGIKHLGGGQQPAPGGNAPRLPGGNTTSADAGGGGLGDILGGMFNGPGGAAGGTGGGAGDLLKGGLGGLLAGGAAGSVLSGGLGGLLKQFQQNGQSDIADFMGQHRTEQGHFRERSGALNRHRGHRQAEPPHRPVAR